MKRNPPGGTVQAPASAGPARAAAWTEIPAPAGYTARCLPFFLAQSHSLTQSLTQCVTYFVRGAGYDTGRRIGSNQVPRCAAHNISAGNAATASRLCCATSTECLAATHSPMLRFAGPAVAGVRSPWTCGQPTAPTLPTGSTGPTQPRQNLLLGKFCRGEPCAGFGHGPHERRPTFSRRQKPALKSSRPIGAAAGLPIEDPARRHPLR